jgi:ligand-binding sensor domain-containing protein/signal transduction histidine kinase
MDRRAARLARFAAFAGLSALLIGAIGVAPAAALDPRKSIGQYVYDVWGTRDGLPVFSVHCVARTPDGYLWVGTEEGLVRFDGVRFTLIDQQRFPDLRANIITLQTDRAGTLWAGTDHGLVRWRNGITRRYTTSDGLAGDRINSLFEDRDGALWIATRSGLSRLEGERFTTYTRREGLPHEIVQSVAQSPDGTIWIATNGGLTRLRQNQFSTLTMKDGLASDLVQSVYAERSGVMWAGTFAGLHRIDVNGRITRYTTADGLSHNLVNEIVEDAEGSLWLSTYGGGLTRYRGGRFDRFNAAAGLAADFINTIYLDRDGSLWIAMAQGGLGRLRDGLLTPYTMREGLPYDSVRVIMEDRTGAIWIGTHGGGLARLQDGRVTTFTTKDGLPSDLAFSLAEDTRGRLWVGTYNGGLSRWEQGRFRTIAADRLARNQFIAVMQEDRAGAMWLGTYGGGVKRVVDDEITTFTTRDGLADNSITAMTLDAAGALWIGTYAGLTRYADGRFTSFTAKDGLPDVEINALFPDTDGSLWVATDHGGLARVKNGRITPLESARPIFGQGLLSIQADDRGYFWCSSNRGIYRVARQELHEIADGRRTTAAVVRYDAADGMKTQECNGGTQPAGWRARDGTLWFPTERGVIAIDPARLRATETAPRPIVEEVIVDGATLMDTLTTLTRTAATTATSLTAATTEGVSVVPVSVASASAAAPASESVSVPVPVPIVKPGSRQVEFHYTAPYLTASERVRFRYRLDGYDPAWVDAGARRIAYYTDLPPGAHTFRVAAAIDDGPWSELEGVLAVHVAPRFYQTWWFATGVCVAMAGTLWGAHRYRVNQLLAVERVRTRIASDLHDDIGSSLSQIAILSEVVTARVAPAPADIAEPLARIGVLSRESVDAMGDIVWAVSPDLGTPVHLSQRMRRLASDLLPARGIELHFESSDEGQVQLGIETRREVFLIFKEALHNIVRHANATDVSIVLTIGRRVLHLEVRDNGRGFAAAATDVDDGAAAAAAAAAGQGLRSMRRRAAAIGGRLSIASAPGAGTTIALDAPIR